ncbi:Gfo/Idh/MocA family protein [Paenibacillus hodogayensis]|uniref:Gfo/Idh/MocA family protein n=1 Tax=Paenibacillus hodogayensis TaxID=279208 RepID=A0ABV5VYP2_9BACL
MKLYSDVNALVVGYGSAGRRHCRLLRELGCRVSAVTRQHVPDADIRPFRTIAEACLTDTFDYAVIANRTDEHHATLLALREAGYTGDILVEKPLFADADASLPSSEYADRVYTAYNLRYHPVLQRLKEIVRGEQTFSVMVYTGQYLPSWRNRDYRQCYSARRHEGGGVLRDLSHELDYVQWLFGPWRRAAAIGGRFSPLEIDSDDTFALLLATERCPVVTIQINYVDRIGQRKLIVNGTNHTYSAELFGRTLQTDGRTEAFECDADYTYHKQHLDMLSGTKDTVCTLGQALDTMRLIGEAERAALLERWMHHEKAVHDLRARGLDGGGQ